MLPSSRGPSSRRVSRSTRPTPGSRSSPELVAVAQQLQPAADREHDRAAVRRGVQRVALDRREVARAQRLVAVLAAAEVEEVVRVGVDLVADARAGAARSRARATRSGARTRSGCRGRRRCSSGRDRARRRAACAQARSSTTSEPTCSAVGAIVPRRLGREPGGAALGLEPLDGQVRELDHVVLLGHARRRARRCGARARSASPPGSARTAVGWEAKRQPPTAPTSGSGSTAVELVEVLERRRDRDREQPAGDECAARARRGSRARSGQQLDRLHRDDRSSPKRRRARSRAASADDRLDAQPAPARARERREQLRLAVERGDRRAPRAASSSATRPVPAPTSSTGPRSRARELPPQRQVGAVAAALDVVPDHQRREGRALIASAPATWPRRASRSRSSSSAV